MSSRGGLNVAISLVLAMFRKRHVFRRCVLNEFRSRFQWKIVCSGGAQELKTVEILVRKWYFWFSLFFRGLRIQRNVRKPWKFKVHLTLRTVAKRWFSLPRDGRHVKIEVFQESLWSLPGNNFGGFRGRWKREKGRPKRVQRCPVKCLSEAQNLKFHYYTSTRAFAARRKMDMSFQAKHRFHCYTSSKWLSERHLKKKKSKFRSPYGVTGKGFSVIFDDFDWNPKVDIWKFQVEP